MQQEKFNIDDKYVDALCQKYSGRGVDDDELHGLAQEGILKAREKYDTNGEAKKGIGFQSFATLWIKERFLQRFKELEKGA